MGWWELQKEDAFSITFPTHQMGAERAGESLRGTPQGRRVLRMAGPDTCPEQWTHHRAHLQSRKEGQVWISTRSHRPLLLSNARPSVPQFSGEGGRGTERLLLTWESQRADSRVVTVPPLGCRDPQLQFICVWGLKEPQLSSLP